MGTNKFYDASVTYLHFSGYKAVYIGKGRRNKHVYKVTETVDIPGWNIGDTFYPNKPELYFTII